MNSTAQTEQSTLPLIKDLGLKLYAPAAIPGLLTATALSSGVHPKAVLLAGLLATPIALGGLRLARAFSGSYASYTLPQLTTANLITGTAAAMGGMMMVFADVDSTRAILGSTLSGIVCAGMGASIATHSKDLLPETSLKQRLFAIFAGLATGAVVAYTGVPEMPATPEVTPSILTIQSTNNVQGVDLCKGFEVAQAGTIERSGKTLKQYVLNVPANCDLKPQ